MEKSHTVHIHSPGWIHPMRGLYWISCYHWSKQAFYWSLMCMFVYCQQALQSINVCLSVCVCVGYFTWWPPSWPAGRLQGSEGHCPQLVMSPTLCRMFVSIIKHLKVTNFNFTVSLCSESEYISIMSETCMKVDVMSCNCRNYKAKW